MARPATKQKPGIAPLDRYITAHDLSMTRLLNAARAIVGPSGIFKWEGLAMADWLSDRLVDPCVSVWILFETVNIQKSWKLISQRRNFSGGTLCKGGDRERASEMAQYFSPRHSLFGEPVSASPLVSRDRNLPAVIRLWSMDHVFAFVFFTYIWCLPFQVQMRPLTKIL